MTNQFVNGFRINFKKELIKGTKRQRNKDSQATSATLNLNKNIEFLILLVIDIQKKGINN